MRWPIMLRNRRNLRRFRLNQLDSSDRVIPVQAIADVYGQNPLQAVDALDAVLDSRLPGNDGNQVILRAEVGRSHLGSTGRR